MDRDRVFAASIGEWLKLKGYQIDRPALNMLLLIGGRRYVKVAKSLGATVEGGRALFPRTVDHLNMWEI